MKGLGARGTAAMGIFLLGMTSFADAQENLDLGKSGAQLYASDCAICHKTPQGLTRSGGVFGLESFLREHYTASRESAAAIAAYVKAQDTGPAAPAKRAAKRNAKGDGKSDKPEGKSEGKPEGKAGEKKPDAAKSPDTKPAESKPAVEKPVDTKPDESKPADKPTDTKPADPADKKSSG